MTGATMGGERIILGAGLSGLSAAFHLGGDVPIFDRAERPGGLCRSVKSGGYVFDHGPHILFSAHPYASRLIKDLLGDELQEKEREAYICHDRYGIFTRFPFQAHLYGLPVEIVRDCLVGLFEAYADPERARCRDYREWILKTFGKGIAEHLMFPYASKLWTVPPEAMSFEWIERRVPTPPIAEIVTGALMDASRRIGFNNVYWYPRHGGIETLVHALAAGAGEVRCGAAVTAIDPRERWIEINGKERIRFEQAVSTLPLPDLVPLIHGAPESVRSAASSLEHNSILVVNLGIDRPAISPIHWCYFYEDPFCYHRLSFPMNFSPHTVPAGKSSVSTEIAYSRHRPLVRDGIVSRVRDGLERAGFVNASDAIEVEEILDIHYAYIIYDHDHRKNVDVIHRYLSEIGIIPCGRFGEWEYFNMDHSILSGKRAAERAVGE